MAQQAQSHNIGNPAPLSMVDQDTVEQPIVPVQGSTTGPRLYTDIASSFVMGPVSPHQSGINSLPAMFSNSLTNSQTLQPLSSAPDHIPSQPLQPFGPYAHPSANPISSMHGLMPAPSPPLQPFGVQPIQPFAPTSIPPQGAWTNWPTTHTNSQSSPPPLPTALNKARKKKQRFPIWARVAVAMLLLLLILSGSGAAYYEANFAAPVGNIVNQQAPRLKGEEDPNQSRNTTSDILSGGRLNILLLGSDTDEKFQGLYLAQTDIVITIDPSTNYVGMLSIPRDLYVSVPNYGAMKLDEAYATGQRYQNNAVGLSRLTIYQNFGIPINYYAWVGLDGFIKVINTAGGVDIDATHPITDDIYPDDTGTSQNAYAYKRLYIAPGPQHFDGPTALEYVRSRHADLVGDFGRSARQQQVLSQLKSKLVNSNIISKLPAIAQDLNGYLKTDMQILDVVKLMNFARTIDPNKIQRVILSPPTYSYAAVASDGPDKGEDIFLPNCPAIQKVTANMFALGNNAKCQNMQASHSGNSVVISTPPTTQSTVSYGPPLQVPTTFEANNSWQTVGQMASLSLNGSSNHDSLGIRSLLDLLLVIVFESPIGLQL